MAYYFYLGKMLCPVAPSKVQIKIKNQNKTITLMNEGEVNLLKKPGLSEISFDLLLPNVEYPFATYKENFENAKFYLDILEDLKTEKETFQFIVSRLLPNDKVLFDTNMTVSLEDYSIKEDAKEGFDEVVSIKLKQSKDYGTKTCKVSKNKVSTKKKRKSKNTKNNDSTYKVKKGDCLWTIAKKLYGNGSKYTVIYNANKDKIKNPNLIYPGQVLTIPKT